LAPTGQTGIDQRGHERKDMRGQACVVLTVLGGWEAGRHEICASAAAAAADTAAWTNLLAARQRRGRDPNGGRMVVSAGRSGRPAARAQERPPARPPRCGGHTIRGLERSVCSRDRVTTDPPTPTALRVEQARQLRRQPRTTAAHAICEAPTRTEADVRRSTFQARRGEVAPAVVRKRTQGSARRSTLYQFDGAVERKGSTLYSCKRATSHSTRSKSVSPG